MSNQMEQDKAVCNKCGKPIVRDMSSKTGWGHVKSDSVGQMLACWGKAEPAMPKTCTVCGCVLANEECTVCEVEPAVSAEGANPTCKCGHAPMMHNTHLGICVVCNCEEYTPAPAESGEKCKWCGFSLPAGIMATCSENPNGNLCEPTAQPAEGERGIEDLLLNENIGVEYNGSITRMAGTMDDINRRITEAYRRKDAELEDVTKKGQNLCATLGSLLIHLHDLGLRQIGEDGDFTYKNERAEQADSRGYEQRKREENG